MIASFNHKGLKAMFDGNSRYIEASLRDRVARILFLLDNASIVEDLNISGLGLHQLKGRDKNALSIKVSGNWRITFRLTDGNVEDVDLVDYH